MIHPVSRALFYRTFSGKGYKDKTVKSCLCSQCFANREAFQQLAALVETICAGLSDAQPAAEQLKQRLSAIQNNRINFHVQLVRSSDCSTYCTPLPSATPARQTFKHPVTMSTTPAAASATTTRTS